ncbi:MAG: CHAT domain-containing protein [Acidobacteriota bacterium]
MSPPTHSDSPEALSPGSREDLLQQAGATRNEEDRRSLFANSPHWIHDGALKALCDEASRLLWVDVERATALADAARFAATLPPEASATSQPPSPHWYPRATRVAANTRHCAGETEAAQTLYHHALRRFERQGEELEAAITRSSGLLNLAYLGEYDAVERWERAARETFERLGDRLRLAILEHNFANILYRRDHWSDALETYQRAYREFLALDRAQDVAVCLRNMAVCHISLHNFEKALEIYGEARAYCLEHDLPRLVLLVDYNIAYLYYLRGEYTRAIQLYRSARRQCEKEGDEYHQALCDLDSAEIYLELNMPGEAMLLARRAFDSFDAQKMPYESAKALTNLAIAESRQGRGETALTRLAQARDLFQQEQNQLWCALIDFYRAVVLYRQQRPGEAMTLAEEARQAFTESALAPKAAMCDLLLSELLLATGQTDRARSTSSATLDRLQDLDLPALEHQAYLVLGQVAEAVGDQGAALDAYGQARQRAEGLRSQIQSDDLKIAFLEDKQVVYESLFWLTMELRGEDPGRERCHQAFRHVERAKSRGLMDFMALRAHELPTHRNENLELAQRVKALRQELNWLYRQLDEAQMRGDEGSRDEAQRLHRGARSKEDDLLRALRELQATDRELRALQSGNEVEISSVRATLPQNAALVDYFIARGEIFAVVLDEQHLRIRHLTSATSARRHHRLLQLQLSKACDGPQTAAPEGEASRPSISPWVAAATYAHLRELYDELFAPLEPWLTEARHLVFAPHGFLHYLPFHALCPPPPSGQKPCPEALWKPGSALADRYSISYAPSASVFHLCATKKPRWQQRSLILGVTDQRAPHIDAEARAVAQALPESTLRLGEEATEEALRSLGASCRYLHLATHGLFRRDSPVFSAIQLGDSRLSLFDLYTLELSAELVVLSGCGTGLNAVLGADELVGLTRGLLYAGAHAVLVTLWDVNDRSTASLMKRFYHHLSGPIGPAEALRRAMLEARSQLGSPYHWAPFLLVGAPGALP